MITSLRGTVIGLSAGSAGVQNAIVDVGGIGYAVAITTAHAGALRVGAEALVHTTLIVREDELSLYGFASRDELLVFDLLRGVTGVGPKSALGVLSAMTPGRIAAAVAAEDDGAFRKVTGIGPKTAKLIILSLSGKLLAFAMSDQAPVHRSVARVEALTALTSLGFPERRAQEALDEILSDAPDVTVQALVRLALAALGPAGVR